VVDDEKAALDFLSDVLSQRGFPCRGAASAGAPIELLSDDEYGLVVADTRMPDREDIWMLRQVLANNDASFHFLSVHVWRLIRSQFRTQMKFLPSELCLEAVSLTAPLHSSYLPQWRPRVPELRWHTLLLPARPDTVAPELA